ncbi:MAG: putative bifunctional diguanylate cyclase/phosphodiesterase [Terracidiphilus sp.]
MNLPVVLDFARSRLTAEVLDRLSLAVAVVRGDRLQYVNAAFTRQFGYDAEELAGNRLWEFLLPSARPQEAARWKAAMDRPEPVIFETVRVGRDGATVDVALESRRLPPVAQESDFLFTFQNISDRKRMEAKLQHDALHDALTGLPNRALFLDRLSQEFARRSRRSGQNCGVLFLDLDRFKEINDSLGHATGDLVLKTIAGRLSGALRPQDTAARLGGDEFAILVDSVATVSDLEIVAGRILGEMEREIDVGGHWLHVGASLGVAIATPAHAAPEMLIRDADFAMYRAKQNGGRRYEVFDKRLQVHVASLQEREQQLRDVIENRRFEIRYLPICGFQTGGLKTVILEGFESLLHFRRTDGSLEDLGVLLPAAEETGLSISLGRETLEAVCGQLRIWRNALPQAGLTMAINLTQRQFYHPGLIAQVKKTLAAGSADPTLLLFEVGESTVNENPDLAFDLLKRLLDCNVRLAVDDFGSGLSPLNYLVGLPIDVVKLDPALTRAATSPGTHSSRPSAVFRSLVQLGADLGIQVVAQGIESAEQLEILAGLGCKLGQGALFGSALDDSQILQTAIEGWSSIAPGA